ncbi:toll-like receptor 4 [Mya arenaria]|uniref:toll-like receptor 4 n=1 Tax=Mya arenaria TaxID=6604 RepID=UPI0022E605B5|nr:toll-like receptor 4 [Mya arenaria]
MMFILYMTLSLTVVQVRAGPPTCTNQTRTCWHQGKDYVCNNMIPTVYSGNAGSLTIQCVHRNIALDNNTFADKSYQKLKTLIIYSPYDYKITFKSNCFLGLKELSELHLSVAGTYIHRGWLKGLDNIRVFNVSECYTMLPENIYEMYEKESMAKLRVLALHRSVGLRQGSFDLNASFWRFVGSRPVEVLDLDFLEISTFDVQEFSKNCAKIRKLSLRSSNIKQFTNVLLDKTAVCSFDIIDVTGMILPNRIRPFCFVNIANRQNYIYSLDAYAFLRHTKKLFLNNICNSGHPMIIKHERNISFTSNYVWNIENISFEGNNLQIIDTQLITIAPLRNVRSFSFSRNNLKFIHPDFFTVFNDLQSIDLSYNELQSMSFNNKSLFSVLFNSLLKIQTVNLSSNHLNYLPKDLFIHNTLLRNLDLSHNYLRTLDLNVKTAKQIRYLNLSYNTIETLNDESRDVIDEIIQSKHNKTTLVDLSHNRFPCSECNNLQSVQWLLDFKRRNSQSITCVGKDGTITVIDASVISSVQYICKKRERIGLWIGFGVGAPLLAILTICVVVLTKRRINHKQKKEDVIALLKAGEDELRFVVFLSFNSQDEPFLRGNVINPLDQHLQDAIGIDRTTVCIGDREFIPGRPISDEIVHSLRKSAMVLILLSDAYTQSEYCRQEFEQALIMDKAIIFLVKDTIQEELLTPTMQELYKKNVRIIWTYENGRYLLKTTWNHVCASIIDVFSKKSGL